MRGAWQAIASILFMLFASFSTEAFEEVRRSYSADISLGSDSNLTRAEEAQNIISDRFIRAEAHAVVLTELTFNKAIILDLSLAHKRFEYTQSLNEFQLAMAATYRWQNEFKYRSPWYQMIFSNRVLEFEGEQRDSNVYTLQAMSSARLTTQINWVAGIEYKNRDSNGSVFDTQQNRIFGNLDYNFRGKGTLYGGASYIKGDIISSVQSNYCNGVVATSIYDLIVASEEVEIDQAFTTDYCGNWISYRLPAKTTTVTTGFNYPVNHRTAIDVSWLYANISAKGNNKYERHIIQANYLMMF